MSNKAFRRSFSSSHTYIERSTTEVAHAHAPVRTKNQTSCVNRRQASDQGADGSRRVEESRVPTCQTISASKRACSDEGVGKVRHIPQTADIHRSEERRVGKECRSRRWPERSRD